MHVWDDDSIHVCLDDTESFDPLRVQRSAAIGDSEAAGIQALCQAATSGPLLIDDHATGEGVVVATLPDGRHIISLSPDDAAHDPHVAQANARLICQARYLLLRMLRDRERWQREREELIAKIDSLQTIIDPEVPSPRLPGSGPISRPR